MEINAAFRRIESKLVVVPVGREGKIRMAAVDRVNDLLGRDTLS